MEGHSSNSTLARTMDSLVLINSGLHAPRREELAIFSKETAVTFLSAGLTVMDIIVSGTPKVIVVKSTVHWI